MKNSVIYLKSMTFILILISCMNFARADFGFSGGFHARIPGQYHSPDPSMQYPYYGQGYPGMQHPYDMQQSYMHPGMQYPYGHPGMQQPYMHPGTQYPYGHPGMQQPYMHPGIQYPYHHPGMQQHYGYPGMQQPYMHPGMQQHYGHPGMYGAMDKDHIKDQVKAQFRMNYPGARDDQWENYWDHYKMQNGIR